VKAPGARRRAAAGAIVVAPVLLVVCAPLGGDEGRERGLPGALPFHEELQAELAEVRESKGPGYRPRTRHLTPDGSALYTNRLLLETSPYLLQHAHNPVNWYPWGDEAFDRARKEGRPVLLSVGYSTCHWCHVMEEESFEDEDIARYLNEKYVAIKVDREERPDVDAIYMRAVQLLSGRGGWPMTVWLTPDREPFFAGTYFPARDGDRGARNGFLTLLRRFRELYDLDPERVASAATALTHEIRQSLAPRAGGLGPPPEAVLAEALRFFRDRYDAENGGLSGAPKFPSSLPVRFLLRQHRRTGDTASLDMAIRTLEKMAGGGIHDHLGGGFHRYATDERWLVPHFEKMLYDNALLTLAYLEGYQATGREALAGVARKTLDYVQREMSAPEGGFFSATDADSLGPEGHREEGYFFTWTPEEIADALGPARGRAVAAYYSVTEGGNFEGRSILNTPRSLEAVAAELEVGVDTLESDLERSRKRLLEVRAERPPPLRDEKSLAAWNGLMISAFARAAFVLGDDHYAARAARAADFVLTRMREGGLLHRSFKDGRARLRGYLDDYAFVIAGLLDLYETTGEARWLRAAIDLDGVLARAFEDPEGGGYFLIGEGHEPLLAREKPALDGAEPSGNSVQALNLLRLYELTTDDGYRRRAEGTLTALGPSLSAHPSALPEMLLAVDFHHDVPKQIVIVTPSQEGAEPFLVELRGAFVPNRVLAVVEVADVAERAELVPLVKGKLAQDGRPTAYVCERQVCKRPTTDPAVFARQIQARSAVP
jgi:uncharacterized protein YyaL (SSP411 family)